MKKIIALLLAVVMVFGLVACASSANTPAAEEKPADTTTPAAETPAAEETPAADEAPAEEAPAAE